MVHHPAKKRPSPGFEFEPTAASSMLDDSPFEQSPPPPLPARSGPKLALVAQWPFAPDAANAGTDVAEPRSPVPSSPGARVKSDNKPKSVKPRPASKLVVWSGDGTPPKRSETKALNAKIPGVPLPPATDDLSKRPYHLRRSESVIAEAVAARHGIGRVHALARRASTCVRDVIAGSLDFASLIGEGSIRAVRKFEAMPRRRQIMWVATPYAVVIVLVLLLVHLRSPESAAANVIAPQTAAVEKPIQVKAPVPAPDPTPVAVIEKPVAQEPPPAKPEKISGTWQEVQALTWLRSTPEIEAEKLVKLKAGSKVIIFSEIATKEGWLVAQKPGGEIGFLKATSLEKRDAEEKPVVKKKLKAKAKKASSRSRRAKIDPIAELERRGIR
jgi:hypothetical protein